MVEVYVLKLTNKLEEPIEKLLHYFPTHRQERILRYEFLADRNRTIWAELLARSIVAKKMSRSIYEIQIERSENGKPYVVNSFLKISLSHSKNWAVCSVGEVSSGVDVEIDSTDALAIAKRFFLPSEVEKIISLPKNLRERQFLIYWTLKESYFKLTGDENFLQADSEKILSGAGKIIGKNFFLNDGAVGGVCVYKI